MASGIYKTASQTHRGLFVHGMGVAHQSPDEVLGNLGSMVKGLAPDEASRRLAEFGYNRIEEVVHAPLWLMLLQEFTHFFALILWVAALLAFLAAYYTPGQGMFELGIAIMGVILINGVFSFWQTYRAERALAALRQLLPQMVDVMRGGNTRQVLAEELVPGDVVLLSEGAKVPADCRLIESSGLRVNLATLTGEPRPKARSPEADTALDPLQARNLLLAGTTIVSGECRAVVYATGMSTEFGLIAHLTQTARDSESPLQKEIRRVSRLVAFLALGIGVLFFVIGHLIGLPFLANFMFAIGIIVANVPEGLLPTVTLSLAMATQRMAKRNALVRHLPSVEALGCTTVIFTDKTGTLTQNCMHVRELFVGSQRYQASDTWPEDAKHLLRSVTGVCHTLRFINDQPSGDPMEIALWQFAGPITDPGERMGEIAFEAERRRMSVITRKADGSRSLWCKGAPETVLPLCTTWLDGNETKPLDEQHRLLLRRAQEAMADRGLRVLALAWRPFGIDEDIDEEAMQLCGLIALEDPPRPDVKEAVMRCHEAGVRVIMVTGDHPHTAVAVAREVGLIQGEHPVTISGDSVRHMSRAALQLVMSKPELVFARVTAEQKMLIVKAMQSKGEIVAVTGDGVNDAPALKSADIGIAMGLSGTDVAREAADIVLLDDHFATIVNAIEEGRAVYENIRKFLTYILTSNIPELIPFLAFVLFRIPLPLTVIQILAVDLGTDMVPALALGAERPHSEVMRRPPRPRDERLLSWPLLMRAYLFLGPLEAFGSLVVFFFVLHLGNWHYGEHLPPHSPLYLQATTACLMAIVLAQVINLFVCRHPLLPVWRFSLFGNRLLWVGLGVELTLLLLIVYTPLGNELFGTAALPAIVWLYAVPFALLLGIAEEGRKALFRLRGL